MKLGGLICVCQISILIHYVRYYELVLSPPLVDGVYRGKELFLWMSFLLIGVRLAGYVFVVLNIILLEICHKQAKWLGIGTKCFESSSSSDLDLRRIIDLRRCFSVWTLRSARPFVAG